ncbi:unnamed protein product [Acanthoscelides obtectus]|uniref:ribonuclease H n=1 Tax=Acanthoscelides obtectus TaxID=200917 RepID=A0A9P0L9H7_ACAOB|nr:unnamed protein product [Acanthoscelides obtectus]CAK1632729.1 hypothetical protein AOBTE_LOCUS7700 [Acanthoscelides obtectus]
MAERIKGTNFNTDLFRSIIPCSSNSPPWTVPLPDFDTTLKIYQKMQTDHREIYNRYQVIIESHPNFKLIFTDASKSSHGVGYAAVSDNQRISSSLPQHCSVYTGELTAIKEALNLARTTSDANFLVVTDSLSALEGIKQLYPRNCILRGIKDMLRLLYNDKKRIKFLWVPSHTGIPGNEEADKEASRAALPSSRSVIRTPYQDLKGLIKVHITSLWQQKWNGSHSKLLAIAPDVNTRFTLPSGRRNQIIMSRLRIGHTLVTHKHIFEGTDAPVCSTCNQRLTVVHILMECPTYQNARSLNHLSNDISEVYYRSVECKQTQAHKQTPDPPPYRKPACGNKPTDGSSSYTNSLIQCSIDLTDTSGLESEVECPTDEVLFGALYRRTGCPAITGSNK